MIYVFTYKPNNIQTKMNKKEQILIGIIHIIHDDNLFGTRFRCFLIKAFLKKYTKGKDSPPICSSNHLHSMPIRKPVLTHIVESNKQGKIQAIQKLFEHRKIRNDLNIKKNKTSRKDSPDAINP